ncbi:peroxiredoxin [Thermonema lapsum]|uniref:Peroxiredoxin n=1 Tax=Thermonema lapsum TaxID=28195 RepID=A0A846MSB4_9BACT|nr:thioredoxin family protein [Thermonema lapsum]NIK74433.1 peroxiredoxin [Thermonema lapsum]
MARTPTYNIPLGFEAPDFALPDVISGKIIRLEDVKGEKGTVVAFICNHCPYVKHMIDAFVEVAQDFMPQGIGFVAINANDVTRYPEDAPDKMLLFAQQHRFPFPYLFDESQETAKAYFAACTPDINVFDASLKCVYRGQFDASRPGNDIPPTGEDLRKVLQALCEGTPLPSQQMPSIGCNIKWKEGNEPAYFKN